MESCVKLNDNRIKILHVIQSPGGVERYIKSFLKYIDNEKFCNVLICSKDYDKDEYINLSGIKKNMTFHMARHTYATTAMSFGVPIASIAKTMGHANMKMTQHYARVLPEKIIKDINVLNTATQTLQTLYQ